MNPLLLVLLLVLLLAAPAGWYGARYNTQHGRLAWSPLGILLLVVLLLVLFGKVRVFG